VLNKGEPFQSRPHTDLVHGLSTDENETPETPEEPTSADSERPTRVSHQGHGVKDQHEMSSAVETPRTRRRTTAAQAHHDTLDADPDQSRRKRRKVTPVERETPHPTSEYANSDASQLETLSWRGQLSIAAQEVHGASSSQKSPSTPEGLTRHESTVHANEDKQHSTGSQRRHQAHLTSTATSSSERGIVSDQPTCAPVSGDGMDKPRKVTPKKRLLQLTSNGKLLKSSELSPKKAIADQGPRQKKAGTMILKGGRMVPSMPVALRYGTYPESKARIAIRIEEIMSMKKVSSKDRFLAQNHDSTTLGKGEDKVSKQNHLDSPRVSQATDKVTHPFFMSKYVPKTNLKLSTSTSDVSTKGPESERDTSISPVKNGPVAWKDLGFNSKRPPSVKCFASIPSIWPPLELQHIGCEHVRQPSVMGVTRFVTGKLKARQSVLHTGDNILDCFATSLKAGSQDTGLYTPERQVITGKAIAESLDSESPYMTHGVSNLAQMLHPAILSARSRLISSTSAFDRGMPAGPHSWAIQYAPTCWQEVLQPQCRSLHDWLAGLRVDQVKTGVSKDKPANRGKPRKKRARKRIDDLDDFIATSDDDGDDNTTSIKNAILITGPAGCGKTASVYAVASQLGFEVFEIHPGMRRSAKDIFDRVGDMTQNHLVQSNCDRHGHTQADVTMVDAQSVNPDIANEKQGSLAGFLGQKKGPKYEKPLQKDHGFEAITPVQKVQDQKQSLILLEEVDILFEEDKAFWHGVATLIQQSRRPVIMTCNDLKSVPLDDLNLHSVLTYTQPNMEVATELLTYVAAAEGHYLSRDALSDLYRRKGSDLRASLTELNLWCQMTVGSTQGGLDWMRYVGRPNVGRPNADTGEQIASPRTFSKDTFTTGLDLIPNIDNDEEQMLGYAQDSLGLSTVDWEDICQSRTQIQVAKTLPDVSLDLQGALLAADARSAMDMCDASIAPLLSTAITRVMPLSREAATRDNILSAYAQRGGGQHLSRQTFFNAFEPLMVEKLTFPPSQGRLAPSLDCLSVSVATDIAPYVRSIVDFDQRLEQQRQDLSGGSQGMKPRTTRAARAALEGGSKENTRREKWFPKGLDFSAVCRTGNSWPAWDEEAEDISQASSISTQTAAGSPQTLD